MEDEPEPTKTIKVKGVDKSVSRDLVEFYFENSRRSGGGEIENVMSDEEDEDVIYITFKNHEDAESVVRKGHHHVEGKELSASLFFPPALPPSYKNKVLIKGLNPTTTKDCLCNFLEAKTGLIPDTMDYHAEQENVVMVTFSDDIDFQKLEDVFRKSKLEHASLKVYPVPISNCIFVANMAPEVSKDTIEFYFENTRKSGGGQVNNVKMNEDDTCIVYFEDYTIIENILEKEHNLGGLKLDVKRYQECLGRPEGEIGERVLRVPEDLVLKDVDPLKIKFMKHSNANRSALEIQLNTCYTKIWWPGETGHVVLTCTLTREVKNCFKFVKQWKETAEQNFRDFMKNIIVNKVPVLQDIWSTVMVELKTVTVDNPEAVAIFVDKNESVITVVGNKSITESLSKKIDDIMKEVMAKVEKGLAKSKEVFTRLKLIETKMLLADKFPTEMMKLFPDLKVKINQNKNEIVFEGLLRQVSDAKLKMYEIKSSFATACIDKISDLAARLFLSKQTKDHIVKKLKTSHLTAIWDIIDGGLLVYTTSDKYIKDCLRIICESVIENTVLLKKDSKTVVSSESWQTKVEELHASNPGKCYIKVPEDGRKVQMCATDDIANEIVHTIERYLQLETAIQGAHLPEEILKMDENAVTLYKKALEEGKEAINNIRVMIVGHCGVGKTTLTKRLFGEKVDVMEEAASTNGIDVHIKRCKVQLKDKQWLQLNKEISSEIFYNRVASVVTKFSKTERSSDVEMNMLTYKASRHGNASTIALVKDTKKKDATAETSLPIRKVPVRSLSKQEPKQIIQKTPQTPRNIDTYKVKQTKGRSSASDKHIMEMIEDVIECSSSDNSKDIAELSIWDFAGQYVFYGTHQIFLSRRAVYLLVTDLSQHVDSVVEDECYIDAEGETQCKISDFVTFWLNSIHTFCASERSREPPVILVGTFADKLQKEKKQELVEDFFTNLRLNLVHSEAFMHLNEEIAIDNSIIDPNVELLKKKIVEVATKQSYWGELYPARWTILERALMEFKKRGVKVLEKEIFEDTNKKLPLPIETDDELELFLRFHHDAGLILYFSDGKLKNYILLQPQWLVDALKCLITAKQFCIKDQDLCKSLLKFHETAILMEDLIDAVWNSDTPFHQHKGVIIEFMEKLGIIARPQPVDESSIVEDFYIVPCVLKQSVPPKFLRYNYGDCRSTTKLCFTTPSRIIPVQVFNKLLAECVKKWPVSRERGKCLMFCGCAVFDVAELHKLYVFLKDNLIQTWINNYSHLHPEHDIDVCLNVRGFITDRLRQFVRDSRELEVYVVCPKASYNITDSMWKVDSLTQKEEVLCDGHGCPHPIRTSKLLKHWAARSTEQNKDLEVVPTEKQLSRMAQRIGKECRALGRELGLTRAELDHIDMDEMNRTPVDKIAAMLGQWLKRKADSATFAELKRAMIQIGMEWEHVFACL
ncbi:uncharacterized protein LOC128559584 [Mercenaria mercenaria]|uniref:uncharacterized protein LOC128559584 n=1 Tax=Mercenaria mercenaria TaxID=6596 RepID=UPI00234F96E7|nr:uncharacterized protein LOC128559584 [Mercenaria mercenaria]